MLMALCFALNHGVVTIPVGVGTTLLNATVADVGNGVLNLFSLLSSLLFGAPLVRSFGPKGGLLLGMFLYCIYIGCFSLATVSDPGATLQWAAFVVGSACGGLGAGVLWTAQGGYFGETATDIAKATGESRSDATARLAGDFAAIYLAGEVLSKAGFSGLQALGMGAPMLGLVFCVLGCASWALTYKIYDLRPAVKQDDEPLLGKLGAAVALWSDPVIWLLAPTNLAFGFCAAYMNGFVNGTFATRELGRSSVAFLGAVTALVAALLARAYGPLSSGKGGKGLTICIGAACFFAIPVLTALPGSCTGWGWALLVLYILQGSGRAVYESTNRAVFSDFFPGDQKEGAFANCILQASFAFAVCFFLQTSISCDKLQLIVIGLAALTPVGFFTAMNLRKPQTKPE